MKNAGDSVNEAGGAGPEESRESTKESISAIQENLEAIVVAVILALIIRHFAMEAFVIPTGSMAPTLLGQHHVVRNEKTGRSFAVDQVPGGGFTARDPLTGDRISVDSSFSEDHAVWTRDILMRRTPLHGGNKILVNKLVYRFGEPERWDVIVFKYPQDPTRNFIKRLVGLSGETLSIKYGDVFINGKREVKPDDVQRELWFPVYDQNIPVRPEDPALWDPDSKGRWGLRRRGTGGEAMIKDLGLGSIGANAFIAAKGPRRTRMRLDRRLDDYYAYNPVSRTDKGSSSSGERTVADLRIDATVTAPAEGGPVQLGLKENGQSLVLTLPCGGGEATLERVGEGPLGAVRKVLSGVSLEPGRAVPVSLQWFDRRAIVTVDGAEVLRWDDPSEKTSLLNSGVWIEAPKQGAAFENVAVYRDIVYYAQEFRGKDVIVDQSIPQIEIPEGAFFAMGDNAPNSSDGRVWGYVRRGHMVGRAFVVFWPPTEIRLIR